MENLIMVRRIYG